MHMIVHSQIAISTWLNILEKSIRTVNNWKFIRSFTTVVHILRMAACQDRLYLTTNSGEQNVLVYNTNGGLIRSISVPADRARGVIVGI